MSPHQTIAYYRITAKLGEGGMGEVWRATDTKLDREVALKILPPAFASDPDRMARFEREAKLLASLNHPNIAQIYGVEERALVMELVEGVSPKGPMPFDDAWKIASQIAAALEYAHERRIVHRDLKPDNIKITPEGTVKLLDFGLAKAFTNQNEPSVNPENSPTLTIGATEVGVILGTAAYMSPEQAKGKSVDKRADIWAFGVVLYELLTGERLFKGEDVADTLAQVLTKEPPFDRAPPKSRRLLRRCLEKDPRQRLRDIGDARDLLETLEAPAPTTKSRWPWIAAAAVLAGIAVAASWIAWHATRQVVYPLTRLSVDLGPDALTALNLTAAISPDGRRLVFPARSPDGKPQLATRLLDQAQAALLSGTENGRNPFFSPDSQWVGFFADGMLKKISVQGGAPVTLCDAPFDLGGSWGEDGTIAAALNSYTFLSRLPAAGGSPQPLSKLGKGTTSHRWPQILPGGQAVLFTAAPGGVGMENASIEVMSVKGGVTKILVAGGYFGRYLPANGTRGYLIYLHQGVLLGVDFDPVRLELRGRPVPLLEDVATNPLDGGGQFDFSVAPSGHGTLVYLAGKGAAETWPVVWLDSSGKMQPLIATPGGYSQPRFSPDGRRLALTMNTSSGTDIYVYDLGRETMTRLTFGGYAQAAAWAPDGKHIAFLSTASGFGIDWIRSDGSGEPQQIFAAQNVSVPWSFSPDGHRLAYFSAGLETGNDIRTVTLDTSDPDRPEPGKPELFLAAPPSDERVPMFSPDGRWIAYRSNESGADEIYVRPFPRGRGGQWQISTGGGLYAIWSNNGRELFYETADYRIMVVDYTVNGDSFVPGRPRLWSDKHIFFTGPLNLDLAPDGKRFAVFPMPEAAAPERGSVHVTFLLNFFDELRRRIPSK